MLVREHGCSEQLVFKIATSGFSGMDAVASHVVASVEELHVVTPLWSQQESPTSRQHDVAGESITED